VRLVFAGTPTVAVPSLRALLDSDRHDVVAVLTRPDRPAGRGRALRPSPVKDLATDHGIDVLQPTSLRAPEFLDQLRTLAPDCCPVVAYGALVPPEALAIPRHGWVNLHFSLLPAWRGAAPVQHAILAGDEITGATTFQLEAGLDTGPTYGVLTADVDAADTAGTLLDRLAASGADLLLATLDGIEAGKLVPVAQPDDGISYAPKIEVADARVDWSAPALRIDRLVRACTPAPGAWTTWREKRLKLAPLRLQGGSTLAPGAVRVAAAGVTVGTGSVDVVLDRVQPEGKAMMPALDWARGVRPQDDERLI
jgi:methionyl-tRNA formyltransferase